MDMIMAVDRNWAIGRNGNLLCNIPGDLKYFKEKTAGKTVVMGRGTLESLPGGKPLPNRRNIVLTRDQEYEVKGAEIAHSLLELFEMIEGDEEDTFIIGGSDVYIQMLQYVENCYITKIDHAFEADRHFINLDMHDGFKLVWESEEMEDNGYRYKFCQYKRV